MTIPLTIEMNNDTITLFVYRIARSGYPLEQPSAIETSGLHFAGNRHEYGSDKT